MHKSLCIKVEVFLNASKCTCLCVHKNLDEFRISYNWSLDLMTGQLMAPLNPSVPCNAMCSRGLLVAPRSVSDGCPPGWGKR